MVNWQSPVTIANELSPLIPSVPHSPFLSVSDSLPLCSLPRQIYTCYRRRLSVRRFFHFGRYHSPPRKDSNQPVVDGSSFATWASSGAWLVEGVNFGGLLS